MTAPVSPSSRLVRAARTLGVDSAVGYTLLGRGFEWAAKPINLVMTVQYLSAEEMGFFYTFASVLGLQVFFELGIGVVLQQFVSHEAGCLKIQADGTLAGDAEAKTRLSALLHKTVWWYAAITVAITCLVLLAGGQLFASAKGGVAWQAAWVITVVTTACNLLITPLGMTLNGLGQMAATARLSLGVMIATTLTNWGLLAAGAGLLAAAIASLLGMVLNVVWLFAYRRTLLLDLWRTPRLGHSVSWRREVWPLQWRIALSWLSGYFIFQLFTPIAFAYHGPKTAGQIGFSLAILGQVQNTAMVWLNVRLPRFGMLISRGQFTELDSEFFHISRITLALVSIGTILVAVTGIAAHELGGRLADRLLPVAALTALVASTIAMTAINLMAGYLRAHKQEPLLLCSVVSGIVVGGMTYVLGRYVGPEAMVYGFAIYNVIIALPWISWVFVAKRREWHGVIA